MLLAISEGASEGKAADLLGHCYRLSGGRLSKLAAVDLTTGDEASARSWHHLGVEDSNSSSTAQQTLMVQGGHVTSVFDTQ